MGSVAVGVGLDVVDVERFTASLQRSPRFVTRVFTDAERADCEGRGNEVEAFAARFAAKEAVIKALRGGLFDQPFHAIEVRRGANGEPSLFLSGNALAQAEKLGIRSWLISMSHDTLVASAVVVALGAAPDQQD